MEYTNRYSRVLGKSLAERIKDSPRVFHVRHIARANMILNNGKRADDCYHTIVLNDDVDIEDFKRVFKENSCIKKLLKNGQREIKVSKEFINNFIDKLEVKRVKRVIYEPFSERDKKVLESIRSKIQNFYTTEEFKQFHNNITKLKSINVIGNVDVLYQEVVKNTFLRNFFKLDSKVKTVEEILLKITETLVSRQLAKLHIEDFEMPNDNDDFVVIRGDNYIIIHLTITPEHITEDYIKTCDENTVILSFDEIPVLLEKYHGKKIFYVNNLKELIKERLIKERHQR